MDTDISGHPTTMCTAQLRQGLACTQCGRPAQQHWGRTAAHPQQRHRFTAPIRVRTPDTEAGDL